MNSWSESIALPRPLRDAPLAGPPAPPSADDLRQAELQARYQLGLADGEKALRENLLQQRAELQELVQGLLQSLRQSVPQVIRDTENTMVSLALAVSQKLVADLPVSSAMVEAAVRDALAQVEGAARFTVRLHRADLELLQKSGSPLLSPADGQDFRFLSSPEVSRGGCLVETNFGTVDGRRETKFDLLKKDLLAC
ncbi:MAG TPA: FliH/SctL family protein [Candidatus Acidoferrum sp.]|nr:FliH/SctL family protein [Candidatus Acidoferrum sp.]